MVKICNLSLFQFTEPCDTAVYVDEVESAVPEGVWRIGKPCEDDELPQRIFMSLAPFVSDEQLSPQNLREKNMELRKSKLQRINLYRFSLTSASASNYTSNPSVDLQSSAKIIMSGFGNS